MKAVDILEADVRESGGPSAGLEFHAKWTVLGTVGHWGHIHTRKNQYEAEIGAEPVDGNWRITKMDVLEEERVTP